MSVEVPVEAIDALVDYNAHDDLDRNALCLVLRLFGEKRGLSFLPPHAPFLVDFVR